MQTTDFTPLIRKIFKYRRKARVDFVLSKIVIKDNMNVLDIGCGIDGRSFEDHVLYANWIITGVDILPAERIHHKNHNFTYIQQNAQNLSQFKDEEFDLVVSIGMLEHITEDALFRRIVSEIRRLAKQYIVIVPNKYCWIEPHYGVPFFSLLPYSMKLALVKIFNLSNHRNVVREDPNYIRRNFRWLSNSEYLEAFPDAKIYTLPTLETIAIIKTCYKL